ncbi:MAG: ATP-binding protein, partial [Lysobacterales bacterium]
LQRNPIAIDEAQMLPELFPALRVAIDRDRSAVGKYLLSGSSSPDLLNAISESLAGRVGSIELAPFSFSETNAVDTPSLLALFAGEGSTEDNLQHLSPPDIENIDADIARYWFQGGYPEPWLGESDRFSEVWTEQYLKTYVERDVARLFPNLNPVRFRRFVELLAGCSGSIINYSNIAKILDVSQPTARDYFGIAHGTFLWRTLPAYRKNVSKRVSKHPRGYLRDSGILHHILQIPSYKRLLSHPQMGSSWEGMVIEEILRTLSAAGVQHRAYYYRTSGGAEVDLIVEGKFVLVPFEIRYTQNVSSRHLRALRDFVSEFDCAFGVVINNDEKVRRYDERLLGIPFSVLTATTSVAE